MLLSVIIVNYNVKYFLEQCLCSLQAALTNIAAEVFVVDNCSADGSIDYLPPHFSWVSFIRNSTNEGFAKANNKALRLARGKYVLFLNPDTILAEDTLQQCITFLDEHANAGAIGVRMIDGSGAFLPESKRAFPSPLVSFYKLAGLAFLFPASKVFNRYALGFLPQHAIHEVDVLAGAFMMIKKSVLDKTGGFDEQFFMYAEDIDLSYRIQQAGYKNFYLGHVTIVHFKGESTKKGNLQYVHIFYEAMRLFVKKHYSGGGAWAVNKGLYAGILLRQFIAALALPFYKKKEYSTAVLSRNICLTGAATQVAAALDIIKSNYPQAITSYVQSLQDAKVDTKENTIVFCAGTELTYKAAIRFLQSYCNASLFMWYGKGSRSIAGSSNKNASGDVIAYQQQ